VIASRPSVAESKLWPVVRVASGNFLEMYDFQVFGYYAAAIAHTFFPSGNEFASLMLSLATFGAGFLMRPLGAIILGAYIDEHGRRAGLLLTLSLMAVGTLSIACTPGYATIGLLAPLLIVAGRLVQGFIGGSRIGRSFRVPV
jgi:MFS family permease